MNEIALYKLMLCACLLLLSLKNYHEVLKQTEEHKF